MARRKAAFSQRTKRGITTTTFSNFPCRALLAKERLEKSSLSSSSSRRSEERSASVSAHHLHHPPPPASHHSPAASVAPVLQDSAAAVDQHFTKSLQLINQRVSHCEFILLFNLELLNSIKVIMTNLFTTFSIKNLLI